MTNEMVLERTSCLVMPSHYVELDEKEMSYVDGGKLSYYYGWDGVLQCISCVLFGVAGKLGVATYSLWKSLLSTQAPKLLAQSSASSIFSILGQGLSAMAWIRLAVFGVAILAGVISMLAVGNSKIAVHSIFGLATSAFYLGSN